MCDRPSVVPVGRGYEGERPDRRERGPQRVEVVPLGFVAEPADDQSIHRPRRTEDLERRQPEALRLVLHGHRRETELDGQILGVDDARGCVGGEAPVESSRRDVSTHWGACCTFVAPTAGIDEDLWCS